MNERVIRYSKIGIVFFLTVLLGYTLKSTDFDDFKVFENLDLIKVAIAILSTPLIGFLISTSIISLLHIIIGSEVEFSRPDEDIEQMYLTRLHVYLIKIRLYGFVRNRSGRYEITDLNRLYIGHQVVLRTKKELEEVIKYSTRRYDVFWMNINMITTIVLGTALGLFFSCAYTDNYRNGMTCFHVIIFILLFAYIILGLQHAISTRKEADRFEKLAIANLDNKV